MYTVSRSEVGKEIYIVYVNKRIKTYIQNFLCNLEWYV